MGQSESFHEEEDRQEEVFVRGACSSTCPAFRNGSSNQAGWQAAITNRFERHGAMRVPRPLFSRSSSQLPLVGHEVSQRATGVPWLCQGEQLSSQERPLELITCMCGPHEEHRPSVDAEFGLSDWQVAAVCRGRQQLCTWYPTTPTSAPRREWADDHFGISDAQLSGLVQDERNRRAATSLPSCCERDKNCRTCTSVAVLSDALCPDYSEDEDGRAEKLVPVLTPYDEHDQSESYCGYSFA
mmetsp:Transcript_124623/g.248703  ORF Transcript_124623/g.248703 Transcript_124623/m.248703 type:complete len:241 (-) Transcript_124623:48-770(-)|eukprot:CAMPEP_0172699054 /NCGR_PEP_ID=MMETSP1074-20121228/29903_1 /TAXON_ID=2916 /ORGANISM="Ceratium fusus, Strain PA161109" /LENGTH=240 /DNA_ID=CAMNT_0013520191 /DNA_START=133 /DNA_END=855 /DNA_ORIENTATION=-